MDVYQWLMANYGLVLAVLLGISESLALIPQLKANGVLDWLIKTLKALAPKDPKAL